MRILGKRPDGYHNIRTVLQTISLCDQLRFESSADSEIHFSCSDRELPVDEGNLVVRAATFLREESKTTLGGRIHLEKQIPAQAGLGGGSSNAAVTLLGLTRLWRLRVDLTQLETIAARIGTDVPFFLYGGCAMGTGTGAHVSALADPPTRNLVVITPNVRVATIAAYEACDRAALTSSVSKTILASSRNQSHFGDSDQWDLKNDFERVIFDMEPEIRRAREALLNVGARQVMLAGSGSSVFGIFDDLDAQERASGMIKAEVGWRVFPCATISRSEYACVLSG